MVFFTLQDLSFVEVVHLLFYFISFKFWVKHYCKAPNADHVNSMCFKQSVVSHKSTFSCWKIPQAFCPQIYNLGHSDHSLFHVLA